MRQIFLCKDCGKKVSYHSIRCSKCHYIYKRGKHGTNHKHGKCLIKSYCQDCNKLLSRLAFYFGYRRCLSCARKFLWTTKEHREKIINKNSNLNKSIAMKKRWKTSNYRELMSKIMNSSEYKVKLMNGIKLVSQIKPNKPEKQLQLLLQYLFKHIYKFVGDFSLYIKGFNPDFVDVKNKKIIELYGDYWHNRPDYKERDKRRLIAYKELGYKTLIVWQHELENINKLAKKLIMFNLKET